MSEALERVIADQQKVIDQQAKTLDRCFRNMGVVGYQYQRLSPGDEPDATGISFAWSEVVPMADRTALEMADELSAYRYQGKPVCRVRAIYTPKETV